MNTYVLKHPDGSYLRIGNHGAFEHVTSVFEATTWACDDPAPWLHLTDTADLELHKIVEVKTERVTTESPIAKECSHDSSEECSLNCYPPDEVNTML